MYKFIVSVTLFLHVLLLTECLYSGESCYDEGGYGSCIPLYECTSLVDEIRQAGQPMPSYMRDKLQRLTCGYEIRDPMVCCVSSNRLNQESGGDIFNHHTRPPPSPNTINFIDSSETDSNNNNYVEPVTRKPVGTKKGPPSVDGNPNLSLLPQDCGNIESNRIWGGNRTRLYEMPWMVLLSYDSDRGVKLSCGGTIINKWYILTAAHCVSFLTNLRLDGVIVGEYDVRTDPDCEVVDGMESCAPKVMNITIASVIPHPGYSPQTLRDDIALIRLSQPADFSLDSVQPICLPINRKLQTESLAGINAVVAGWGATEEGLQSPVLLSVDLPIVPFKQCYATYNKSVKISRDQICAGGIADKDACGGDSGGPLMYPGQYGNYGLRYIQRGIVSFGPRRCGIAGFPGVYTNIAYYMDWILDHMRP